MFNGDESRISTELATSRLREAGWQVTRAYERLHVAKGDQSWQLAYASATSIAVFTQDIESLLGTQHESSSITA